MKEKKEIHIIVGQRIKSARKVADLTQEELAEQVGISPKFLSDIERGRVGMSITSLSRFCDVLHVSSDYLLARTDIKKQDNELNSTEVIASLDSLTPDEQKVIYNVISSMKNTFDMIKR